MDTARLMPFKNILKKCSINFIYKIGLNLKYNISKFHEKFKFLVLLL